MRLFYKKNKGQIRKHTIACSWEPLVIILHEIDTNMNDIHMTNNPGRLMYTTHKWTRIANLFTNKHVLSSIKLQKGQVYRRCDRYICRS